jgi:uncharacterized Zn-binding protein involved in type VI secretion
MPAARASDRVVHDTPHCHAVHPAGATAMPIMHPPYPIAIATSCPTVNIGGQPAVRVGDLTVACMLPGCQPSGGGGTILRGSMTVNIGGKPAARVGDIVSFPACVGPIPGPTGKVQAPGCATVNIG